MNHFKQFFLSAGLAAGLCASAFAQQAVAANHGAHPSAGALAAANLALGEVRKVDKPAGKITLKHGEIKNLDMPPMTMVFGVKDTAMLDKVKPGDKIRFQATNEQGKYTITEIQAATP